MAQAPPRTVLIGGSAGALEALEVVLGGLPMGFPVPILVVCHLHPSDDGRFAAHLDSLVPLAVIEGTDKAEIHPGCVYVAPADYHLLVEREGTLALSADPRVNWSRPAIDVLFESAAWAWGPDVLCVVLSGGNHDGALGARAIEDRGGRVIVQDPATARQPEMPRAAIAAVRDPAVLSPQAIGARLARLVAVEGAVHPQESPSRRGGVS